VDIAGLVEGASKGEGLGNKFLANIRETDAILHMVRLFPIGGGDKEISHVYGNVDPMRDIAVINLELILADFETVTKRLNNLQKDVKKGDKEAITEEGVLKRIEKILEEGKLARLVETTDEEKKKVAQLNLLTTKPMIYGLNKKGGVKNLDEENPQYFKELTDEMIASGSQFILIDAKIEDELKDFEGDEKEMFRKELGGEHDGINDLISGCYKLLGLETYFTTGVEETRAWTILKGSTAPVAGQAIHTDFKDKFIRAEIVFWKDLLDAGSYGEARLKGKVRTEGKEYIVRDGDVIEFKI
jgi:ribosome-binding ATPase